MASGNLLNNVSALGAGPVFMWGGGDGVMECGASAFNGCSVILQSLIDDGTWQPVGPDTQFAASGQAGFYKQPCQMRGFVSGASPPTGVYASVFRARRT